MTTKLYIGVFILLTGILYSCQKDEEVNKLDADYRVMTDYDSETDFSSFQSYYLADSILFIGQDEKPQYLDSLQAKPILDACHRNMQERGYSRAASKERADLGLQMTYIASTYHFTGYTASPYWWWGFSGYWSPFYWGNWGAWYYPYPISFSVSTGALLTDMLNLKAEQGVGKRLPVVWQSYQTGLLHGSDAFNIILAARGIEQSFKQSEYITNHSN